MRACTGAGCSLWSQPGWVFATETTAGPAVLARYYYLRDHLGSVRATVDALGAVVHHDDYYPFGLRMPNRSDEQGAEGAGPLPRFTGHERERELDNDVYYAGARYFDAVLARWNAVDPLADAFPSHSPYNYAVNNPLLYIDPTGNDTDEVQQARGPVTVPAPPASPSLLSRLTSIGRWVARGGGAAIAIALMPFTMKGHCDPCGSEGDNSSDDDDETVTIYKAPQRGKGQKLLEEGFQPEDFPRDELNDGNAYFAGPNDRRLAEEFERQGPYQEGILEVTVPKSVYDKVFKPLEKPYQGGPQVEVPIPRELFPVLNANLRVLKPR